MIKVIETQKKNVKLNDVSMLDACRILKVVWEVISLRTISNSFIRSGLISDQLKKKTYHS